MSLRITSRLHPAFTSALARVQGGTAYSRRFFLYCREEAFSAPAGAGDAKARDSKAQILKTFGRWVKTNLVHIPVTFQKN